MVPDMWLEAPGTHNMDLQNHARGKTSAGNHCCVLCLAAQSCPTLCDPKDCSPPGSSVHGDSLGKNTRVGCHAFLQGIFPTQGLNSGLPHCRWILYCLSHQGSQEYWSGLHIPSPGELPDPGIKLGLLHCRRILYQPSCHAQPSP